MATNEEYFAAKDRMMEGVRHTASHLSDSGPLLDSFYDAVIYQLDQVTERANQYYLTHCRGQQ